MGFFNPVAKLSKQVKDAFSSIAEDKFAAMGGAVYVAAAGAIAPLNASKTTSQLDTDRRNTLRSEFGDLVDGVKVTYDANLYEIVIAGHSLGVNSAAQTFGDHVYVQERYKSGDLAQLELLAHELTHVRQFHKVGSLLNFGVQYFREFYQAGFDYDRNDMEEEAVRIAACFMIRNGSSMKHAVAWRGDEGSWSAGWSWLASFMLDGSPYMLSYKGNGGTIRVDRLKQDGTGIEVLRREDWSNGWTNIAPFYIGTEPYLLLNKQRTGTTRVLRVRPAAEWTSDPARDWAQHTWDDEWQSGYTHLVSHAISGKPHCFAYKASTGAVRMYTLSATGAQSIWEDRWSEDWSSFLPFRYNNQPHQLAYKRSNGSVRVDRLKPDGKGVDVLWRDDWSSGWTNFSALSNTGTQYIAYKGPTETPLGRIPGHGTVHVAVLAPYQSGGKSKWSNTLWCATWVKGWNSLVTYPGTGAWHSLVYDQRTGAAHIDRFT